MTEELNDYNKTTDWLIDMNIFHEVFIEKQTRKIRVQLGDNEYFYMLFNNFNLVNLGLEVDE